MAEVLSSGWPWPDRHRGGEAPAAMVPPTDRRLVEGELPQGSADAGVAREHLPHPVRPGTWCAPQGTDCLPAYRAGDPAPERGAAPGWSRWSPEHVAHQRASTRGRG